MPISKIITLTGVVTLLLAPFGAFALNLSAITAAICMGREAHDDPAQALHRGGGLRRSSTCVIGLFGAAVTGVLTAFPRELVVAVAGLALLGSIGGGLARGAEGRSAPRGRADHLPRHAQRREPGGHRLGLLGRGCRGLDLGCAVLAAARLDSGHARLPLARVPARPRPPHAVVLRRPLHRPDGRLLPLLQGRRHGLRPAHAAPRQQHALRVQPCDGLPPFRQGRPAGRGAPRAGLPASARTPSRRAASPGRSTGRATWTAAAPPCRTAPTTATAWPSCCSPMRMRCWPASRWRASGSRPPGT